MDERQHAQITWLANQLVKKDIRLPFLRRPKPSDQFSILIESVDHLLTEAHRKQNLILPNLAAFNNNSIGVFTDYSGEGSGKYNVYSILLCGMNLTAAFHERAKSIRATFHLADKEISYKDLNMGQIRRALPTFLEAANQLPGLLYTVAVEKSIRSVFGREPNARKQVAKLLEDCGFGARPQKTAEKLLRIVHLVSYFVALLGSDKQDIFWMTDHDEISPTADQNLKLLELCFARVLPLYQRPATEFGILGGAIPFRERSTEMNDRLSLPDLVAGVLGDYLTKRDALPVEKIFVKDGSADVLLWLTRDGIGLKKICTFLRPGSKGEIERGTIAFAPTNPQEVTFIPIHDQ